MGKYYCDYCALGHDKAQSYIDEITRMFETGGGNSTPHRGNAGNPSATQSAPQNPGMGGPMRPPFSTNAAGPNMPPLPPAMMALMNGNHGMSSPGSGPPPMRFAGPPIMNNLPGGMPPHPPHMNGYSGLYPPQPHHGSGDQPGPPLAARMNPDRARHLGLQH